MPPFPYQQFFIHVEVDVDVLGYAIVGDADLRHYVLARIPTRIGACQKHKRVEISVLRSFSKFDWNFLYFWDKDFQSSRLLGHLPIRHCRRQSAGRVRWGGTLLWCNYTRPTDKRIASALIKFGCPPCNVRSDEFQLYLIPRWGKRPGKTLW